MLNRVLLVDDSKSARFALRKLLERTGLQVDVAESAEQALGYLDSNHPDLIFMDHFMPGMDGFEAARAIKNRPDKSEIPIVMCTSKEGEGYEQQARDNGAVDILPKPATPSALSDVLDKLVANVKKQKAEMQSQESVEAALSEDSPSEDQPKLDDHNTVPTLDDVVVPVDKIETIAAESATKVVEECIELKLADLLEAKVPQLREQVLSKFDKVAKLMLEDSVAKAVAKAREESEPAPVIDLPDILSKEDIERLIEAQVQVVYEQMQREVNEQFAEIYSTIGELKTNQHLKKIAPELMEDILMRAQEAATERAKETLEEVSGIAEKTAKQSAEEVCKTSSETLKEELDNKLTKTLEVELEGARQEASETSWVKIEEATNQLKSKIARLSILGGVSLAASAVALIGVMFF